MQSLPPGFWSKLHSSRIGKNLGSFHLIKNILSDGNKLILANKELSPVGDLAQACLKI